MNRTSDLPNNQPAAFVMPFFSDSAACKADLQEAVRSVVCQSDGNWILYIVDDNSPRPLEHADLGAPAQPFRSQIEILRVQSRSGPGACRNLAVRMAQKRGCPIVLFLDSDDIAAPQRLVRTRAAFAHGEADVVYSAFATIDAQGAPFPEDALVPSVASILTVLRGAPPVGEGAWKRMAMDVGYTNLTSATSVRTELAANVPFPHEMVSEDFHTWLRFGASGGRYYFVPDELCKYRIGSGTSGSSSRRRYGATYYQKKAQVDSQGFELACAIAESSGRLASGELPMMRERFRARLAAELRAAGEVLLAEQLESLDASVSAEHLLSGVGSGFFGESARTEPPSP